MGTPSQSYGTSLAISHGVTCHPTQVNALRLTPAMQAGTRFTYPGGMNSWVDLVDLIAPRPGDEPATFRSQVRRRTVAPPRQLYKIQKRNYKFELSDKYDRNKQKKT